MSLEQPGTILIVDDESINIAVLTDILEERYEILFATDGKKAMELAKTAQPDLILLDVKMPGMDGHEVCARLKEERDTANIPIIFVTAMSDVNDEARGLELGAMDYITKPVSPPVVKARVRNQIELKNARDQLMRLAITDGLTGLSNRRHFDGALEKEHQRLARSRGLLSLILFDLDHFKAFNDTYGHLAGDDCLRQVGGMVLQTLTRVADLGARYGGEEFVCLLPETSHDGAVVMAEKLRAGIQGLKIPHAKSSAAKMVTTSLGVVTVRCIAGRSPLHVVALADEQLYAAKSAGRNRVQALRFDAP
ncbi:Response regulator PleD [Candidatus Magnetaquicoccaceae bacterium FCR-1]|uniref:diguanylate cyclase n=1 Tax=Candidatus Magnetaquiglobus chichijimensis TaxID=3141448 RepID=A0ABQ0C858_9PROT